MNQEKINKHQTWLSDYLDFIKDDMGYETQEEFDQEYKTLCPINMVDIISLEKAINDEINEIAKYCKENNKPITASHIIESLRLGPFGHFQEALEGRRDNHKKGINVIEETNRWRDTAEKFNTMLLTGHRASEVTAKHYTKKAGT